jgi:hypothetical protein
MTWDLSRISGPWQEPIYGEPTLDADGNTGTPISGYQPGVVFVLPKAAVAKRFSNTPRPFRSVWRSAAVWNASP